jgi:hypothetical protein
VKFDRIVCHHFGVPDLHAHCAAGTALHPDYNRAPERWTDHLHQRNEELAGVAAASDAIGRKRRRADLRALGRDQIEELSQFGLIW